MSKNEITRMYAVAYGLLRPCLTRKRLYFTVILNILLLYTVYYCLLLINVTFKAI